MHDHFEESHSRNANIFKMMWIFLPGSVVINLFLLSNFVAVKGVALRVNDLDSIFELYEVSI